MSTFVRLTDYKTSDEKEIEFFNQKNRYIVDSNSDLLNVPGIPISYWVSSRIRNTFRYPSLSKFAKVKKGMDTSNNDYFLKYWFELPYNEIGFDFKSLDDFEDSNFSFAPYNKGGSFRKWYGNKEWVILWRNKGEEIRNSNGNLRSPYLYFKDGITWSAVGAKKFNGRLSDYGAIFDSAGSSCFPENLDDNIYLLALLNTKLITHIVNSLNPTINFGAGTVSKIPVNVINSDETKLQIETLTQECIDISREDWNSKEVSWDFKNNDLLNKKKTPCLEDAYNNYRTYWKEKFSQLHSNEEKLNLIFINIYDLADEIAPDIPLEDITILKDETKIKNGKLVFTKENIIKQLISYAVGCMFGRYSPEKPGLILVNQSEKLTDFKEKVPDAVFLPDEDNIIPILDKEYFSDDIVSRFKEFLKFTFGEETLSENLDFIAKALSKKANKGSEEVIRDYFIKDFYKDHLRMYKKRPIYWMFTSGKGKAFNALVYMHRYDKTTLAKMRMDYLLELEAKMDAQREMLNAEDAKTAQEKTKLNAKIKEIMAYDELLKNKADAYIEIDLDDGVKANYEKFKGLVGKI